MDTTMTKEQYEALLEEHRAKQSAAIEEAVSKFQARLGTPDALTMRDYFAMYALQALDIQAHIARPSAENLARSAYNIADAMIAMRTPLREGS